MGRGIARSWAVVLLASVALVAAGCGGGSGSGSGDDEVKRVLETFFTTSDPVQCEELTNNAFKQLSPDVLAADDPAAECRKSLDPTGEAKSIQVSDVNIDGSKATATLVPDGGTFEGATVKLALVDDGGWKIDGITDVQLTNREEFLREVDARAKKSFGNDAFTAEQSDCIAKYIRREASTDEIEQGIVSGDRTYVYDAVRLCLGAGTDLIAIVQIIDRQLVNAGVDPKVAQCSAGASIAGLKDATLEDFAASRQVQQRLAKAIKQAAQFCVVAGR
jgi:hypothetical protein